MPSELPLGPRISWTAVEAPRREPLRGSHVLLRPVDAALDAEPLFAVSHPPDGDPAIWTYLPDGPYESPEQMREALAWAERAPGNFDAGGLQKRSLGELIAARRPTTPSASIG